MRMSNTSTVFSKNKAHSSLIMPTFDASYFLKKSTSLFKTKTPTIYETGEDSESIDQSRMS